MQIGLLGLGNMGNGMALRLVQGGHDVIGADLDPACRDRADGVGARTVESAQQLVAALSAPRVVWVMLPPGEATESALSELAGLLEAGDLVVDGGNSHFEDAPRRATLLGSRGVSFVDVGVSGGRWGWRNGYGLMIGATPADLGRIEPALSTLCSPEGYFRVGDVGAGHLTKAIHNAIQYGVMQAYAEGFALLRAHTEVDTLAAMSAWQGGSSIRSWLLEQTVDALRAAPDLSEFSARVPDSGMGRWTASEAIRLGIPTPVLSAGLQTRFASRSDDLPNRLLVAARARIGGKKS